MSSAIRAATVSIANKALNVNQFLFPSIVRRPFRFGIVGVRVRVLSGGISYSRRIRCLSSEAGDGKKASSRLSQMRQVMQEAEERAFRANDEPTPKITLGQFHSIFPSSHHSFLFFNFRNIV